MGISTSNINVNLSVNTDKDKLSPVKAPPSAGDMLRDLIEKSQ